MDIADMKIQELRSYWIDCDIHKAIKDPSQIRDIAIMHDMKMYGEDIDLDLLILLEHELDIFFIEISKVLGCDILDYFHPEFGTWWSWFSSDTTKFKRYPRFSIGMLEDAILEVYKNRKINLEINQISYEEAYKAMFFFLERYIQKQRFLTGIYDTKEHNNINELVRKLHWEDNSNHSQTIESVNSTEWNEWTRTIKNVANTSENEEILTHLQGYLAMLNFLENKYNHGFAYKRMNSLMELLHSSIQKPQSVFLDSAGYKEWELMIHAAIAIRE